MDWMMLALGIVLGSSVTTGLIWFQNRSTQVSGTTGYFSRVALSILLTGIVGSVALSAIAYIQTGSFSFGSISFGSGWVLGGLLAAWLITGPLRRT
jgi:hypothetical protein